jgi:hypothetical protein
MQPDARRRAFRAALALRGVTQGEWADAEGITEGHLSHVLNARRESKRLLLVVDEFVRETFNKALKGINPAAR